MVTRSRFLLGGVGCVAVLAVLSAFVSPLFFPCGTVREGTPGSGRFQGAGEDGRELVQRGVATAIQGQIGSKRGGPYFVWDEEFTRGYLLPQSGPPTSAEAAAMLQWQRQLSVNAASSFQELEARAALLSPAYLVQQSWYDSHVPIYPLQ